jgi:cell division protein ZapE
MKQKVQVTMVGEAYRAELEKRGYESDPAQLRAVAALERCADEWAHYKRARSSRLKRLLSRPDIPRGVYLYGGVGRGKSFLMDCFFGTSTSSCAKCIVNLPAYKAP